MSESVKAALSERTSRGRSHLAAGFTGGAFSSAALQPFDVLKTRIQQGQHASLLKTFHSTVGTGEQRSLIRLWRGTLPSIVRSSLGSGMYFYALNEMRQFFSIRGLYPSKSGRIEKGKLPMLSGQANLLTGATARATVGFVMMPVTIIKVRYESSLYAYQSIVHAVKDIYKNHGPRGFFYGSGATAIRDAPYAGLYVYVYEACKSRLNEMVEPKSHGLTTVYINFSSGLLAGFGATLLTNPFDVMRTRMQLKPAAYKDFRHAARRLYTVISTKTSPITDYLGGRT